MSIKNPNINLVEIKLYMHKIEVVNFPKLIKGESIIVSFSITRLVKNYGEDSSNANIEYKKVIPDRCILLMRNSEKKLYKLENSQRFSNTTTFEIGREFLSAPGKLDLQLIMFDEGNITIDKTPLFRAYISDDLSEGDTDLPEAYNYIDEKIRELSIYVDQLDHKNVKSVNKIEPDDTGNVQLNYIKTINGISPDETGNISIEDINFDPTKFVSIEKYNALLEKVTKLESYHKEDESESEYLYYGRILGTETKNKLKRYSYEELTNSLLIDIPDCRCVKKMPAKEYTKISLGWTLQTESTDVCPCEYFIVAVPVSSGLTLYKDNGFGSPSNFEEDDNLGVNMLRIKINEKDYYISGQFSNHSEQLFFHAIKE